MMQLEIGTFRVIVYDPIEMPFLRETYFVFADAVAILPLLQLTQSSQGAFIVEYFSR